MMSATTTTGRKFTVWERMEHADGEQVVLGTMTTDDGQKSYRVGFTNEEPHFGPVVTWGHGDEVSYWVTCDPAGVPESCTCPDFKFKRKRRGEKCKHMACSGALIRAGKFRV